MEKIIKYNELKKDVQEFIDKFNDITKKDVIVEELLQGWRILYSNIIEDCKVLLVGINPGRGEGIGTRNYELEPLEILEYIDDTRNKYRLASLIKNIFIECNAFDLLTKQTMKINTKFYSTIGTNELFEIEKHVHNIYPNLYNEMMKNNTIWLDDLINKIIQPKLIIAEGKSAFDFLDNEVYPNINNDWTNILVWNGSAGAWKRNDGLLLFGFSRSWDNSAIEIAKHLEPILKEL